MLKNLLASSALSHRWKPSLLSTVVTGLAVCWSGMVQAESDWPRFRGPNGSGISDSAVPLEFSADKNVRWKVELPGRGVSSPIVVGEKVFVTCYSGYGMGDDAGALADLRRHLVCLDRKTGDMLWTATEQATLPEDPYTGMGVPAHGYASHTPTSDGERVYAFYGKSGVYAYDLDGNKLWHQEVGKESGRMRWGSSSSPIHFENVVIVMASDESEAMYGFDTKTGKELWKAEAAGFASVWGTPALAQGKDGPEVVIAVPDETWGLDARTGKFNWYGPGNGGGSHSVVVDGDVVYSVGGSRSGGSAVAVAVGGDGEVNNVVWERRTNSRFATPLVYNGYVFTVASDLVNCYDAKTGEVAFEERLPRKFGTDETPSPATGRPGGGERGGPGGREGRGGGRRRGRGRFGSISYASPVLADGKIYITDVSGTVYVIAAKPEFELLAKNDLSFDKSGFNGTPAISDGMLLMRSHSHLYCFGE